MTIHNTPTNWRELLRLLTEKAAERQRVADELGVTSYTVTRWITGESEPRMRYFKRLPDVFPQHRMLFSELIQAELSFSTSLSSLVPVSHVKPEISSALLIRMFTAYATTVGPFRTWSLRNLTLRQAVEHLDVDHLGIELTIIQCTPPAAGQCVRSLVALMSLGTAPWEPEIHRRIEFLGAESLAGWVVSRGEPRVVQHLEQGQHQTSFRSYPHMHSIVAWPLQREGKVAGCFTVMSTQGDYFTSTRLSFVEVYANMLALSFRDNEFYPLESITLDQVPVLSAEQQQQQRVQFHHYIRHLRHDQDNHLSEFEAEKHALQYMEAELLALGKNS